MQNTSSLVIPRLSLLLFLLLSLGATAQPPPSPHQNFVRVERPRVRVSSEKELTLLSAEEKATTYHYFDGLGRTVMTTAVQAGPNFEDLVQPHYYNPATGKPDRTYLGYAKTYAKPGQFVDAVAEAQDFYESTHPADVTGDRNPYAVTEYDAHGRVKSVTVPGEDWHAKDKKTTYRYFFYSGDHAGTLEEVHHWKLNADGAPVRGVAYGSNTLHVTEVTSPDGRKTQHIRNGRKLTIATRRWDGDGWNSTYRVYNDMGRLRYLIPPKVATQSALSAEEVAGFLFAYQYDKRGRIIASRDPGAGWRYAVYDQWNRLVMTHYEGQVDERDRPSWTFYKYDAFNRRILSGRVTTKKSRETLQSEVNAQTKEGVMRRYERSTLDATGYTLTQSYPDVSHRDFADYALHTLRYFDDYDFLTAPGWDAEGHDYAFQPPAGFTAAKTDAVIGVVTGGKVRILEEEERWLNVVAYYDDRLRNIQTLGENHLGGVDKFTRTLDYPGQVTQTLLQHEGAEEVDRRTEYTYDHAGRLLQTFETVGDAPRTMVADYQYNALGQLVEKNIHSTDGGSRFLQSVDYRYTIQGWLASINEPGLSAAPLPGEDQPDLFGMRFNYAEAATVNGTPIGSSYDGNISSTSWSATNVTPGVRPEEGVIDGLTTAVYGYGYNPLNQLEQARYATKSGSSWTGNAGAYDMSAQYEANGNITRLTRQAAGVPIDDLDYSYHPTSNHLQGVKDHTGHKEGMADAFTAPTDYSYDGMGHRTSDLNKEITELRYNDLQLVEQVVFGDHTTIDYVYTATGEKLRKTVQDGQGKVLSRIDYAGNVEYVDGAIRQVWIEGGRAYKQNGTYHHEYFHLDHQGNNRVAFGDLPERKVYTATLEAEHREEETSEFAFGSGEAIITDAENHTPEGSESVFLNGMVANRQLGLAKVLDINRGDRVALAVWARYTQATGSGSGVGDLVSALLTAYGLSPTDAASGEALAQTLGAGGEGAYVPVSNPEEAEDPPDAYLAYLFFDTSYHFVAQYSGFLPVTDASYQAFSQLELAAPLVLDQPGSLFIYLANETREDQEVYFDDLRMVHERAETAFKVSQVNEYYPYGLATNKSWRLKGYLDPWQLYQAGHANFDTLTGNYDFLYRSYDPVLGQFTAADPLAVVTPGHSPYHANYNNPVMFTDPLGLCPECPRDKRYYDARDNFMDYEPTSYVSPNLNGNSWVHSIGRNSRVYERYQMWSDARTLGLDEYVQKYGETYTNMNAYWRYYEEEQMLNGVQVKRPELIISGGVNDGYQASGGGLPIGDGGFLFRNENEAFAYMYSTSLNNSSGEIRELSGWITTMGILVMPYNRNTAYVSRNDYYKIRRSSDSSLAVEFGGIFAPEILGHIHTHPHAHDKGPTLPYFQRGFGRSEGDFAMYDLISSPIFTIGPNNITMGYRDANDQPQRSVVGSRNDGIFIGSIYKWLN